MGWRQYSFVRHGAEVVVTSDDTKRWGQCSLDQLRDAAIAFHRQVGEYLYREYPELRTHPRWGGHMQSWFPELDVRPSQLPSRRERRKQKR
jgi:hypothetical protein